VDESATLLSIVPELSTAIPPIESWSIEDGRPQWVTPITGLDPIVGPLIELLERAKSQEVDSIVHAQADLAKADLFVAQVVNLVRGLNERQLAWALMGVARWSTCIVSGDVRVTHSISPSLARRISSIAASVRDHDNKGVLLSAMSDAISARISAAIQIADLQPSRLVRRMVVSRLVWVVSHKTLDPSVDLPWVATMLGLPLDANVVQMVHQISHIAIETSRARTGTRKERPADALLSQLLRASVGDPLLNTSTGPAVIRALSHLVEPKHIKGRVDNPRLAVRYLDPDAIRTVSGAWSDLVSALTEWDVLSSTIRGMEPVERTNGGWRLDQEVISDAVRWSLRIPRARPQRAHAVVAVRMVELLAAGGGGLEVRLALQECWNKLRNDEGMFTWVAEHGVAVFSSAVQAIHFASFANRNLIGSDGLLPGLDDPIALPPGMRPSVGVALGTVVGGTDGHEFTIDGPALARAMGYCGGGRQARGSLDPLQIRRLSVGAMGLSGHGVACGRDAVLSALNHWGDPIHRYGDNSVVGGVSRDFTSYPVDAWAPDSDGTLLFISLGGSRGADVLEALWVDGHMLRDIQARDQDLADGGDGMLISESPSVEVDDPFDGESGTTEEPDDPFGFDDGAAVSGTEKLSQLNTNWGDIGFGDDEGTER